MTTDNSRSFHCICSYVAFFFLMFSIEVIYVEHLLRREKKIPVVSQWGSYEELHSVQDGAPPHFAVRERFGNHFHVWWIGR